MFKPINVALDLLFVMGFDMGVRGAGIATVISQTCAAILSLSYAFIKVSYSNNKALGSKESKKAPKITLSGTTQVPYFDGSVSGTFDIVAADVENWAAVSAPNVESALDSKGFVKSYKSTPVVTYVDYNPNWISGFYTNYKLKAGKDYTVAYSYAVDTKIFDGKNYVIRKAGTEIGSKDKLLPGTSIRITITGKATTVVTTTPLFTW